MSQATGGGEPDAKRWVERRALAGLLVAYAVTRSWDLLVLPVFLDEALHTFWPVRLFEPGRFLRHLQDGKSLQVWLLAAIQPWSPSPPLTARLLSVVAGGVGLWGAFAVGRRIGGTGSGVAAGAVYLVCPFALFYDRMALADVYVSAFAALVLLAGLRLVEKPGAGRGLALGLALAGCTLAKMTGLVVASVPAVIVLLMGPRTRAVLRGLAVSYAVAAALCAYPVALFLGDRRPWARLVTIARGLLGSAASSTASGAPSGAPVASQRGYVDVILANLAQGAEWLAAYWTLPLILLVVAGAAVALVRRDRPGLVLVFAAVLPVAAFAPVSHVWHPRYIVFSVVPMAVLAGRLLVDVARSLARLIVPQTRRIPAATAALAAALLLALSVPALRFDYALLTAPHTAPLPERDLQYTESWASGYGIVDVARFVTQRLEIDPRPARVVTHRYADRAVFLILRAYLMNEERVALVERDLTAPGLAAADARDRMTFVALGPPDPPDRGRPDVRAAFPGAVFVLAGEKPGGDVAVELFWVPGPSERSVRRPVPEG